MKKNKIFVSFPLNWVKNRLGNLPAHRSLSYFWNMGSFLGIILIWQIITGFFLSFNFVRDRSLSFESIILMTRENFFGFLLRWAHLNGASIFFLLVYLHIFRGLFFSSFRLTLPWLRGSTILILLIGTAFLGYVLPWGQISLWGATVITNLLSTIPFVGPIVVIWVWGGFSVTSYTLGVFYSLHFILPFVILALVLFHLIFLHETGSSSKISLHRRENKIKFYLSFVIKDILNFLIILIFLVIILLSPFKLGDPENFNLANPLSSPLHIQPEWYFLFAYAILRSIPNKLGGVVALVMSVVVFYFLPFFSKWKHQLMKTNTLICWTFFRVFIILTWIGGKPVEAPYVVVGQIFTFIYFSLILLFSI